MEAGSRRPDPPAVAEATVRAAVAGRRQRPRPSSDPGGKSLRWPDDIRRRREPFARSARSGLPGISAPSPGPARHPSRRSPRPCRAAHALPPGDPGPVCPVRSHHRRVPATGEPGTLHPIEGGDHSFGVPKSSGRTPAAVLDELADTLVSGCDPGSWVRIGDELRAYPATAESHRGAARPCACHRRTWGRESLCLIYRIHTSDNKLGSGGGRPRRSLRTATRQ